MEISDEINASSAENTDDNITASDHRKALAPGN